MLRKMYFPLAIVMAAVMLGVIGCAPAPMKPCTVELSYVINRWQGEETVVAEVALSVKNPNTIDIWLDSLTYTLAIADREVFLKTALPKILIPANGEVELRYLNFVNFSEGLGIPNYLAGMDYVPAHVAAVPVWKLLGGKKPPFWAYAAIGILPRILAGDADSFPVIQGTAAAVQGAIDKTWEAAPDGPAVYTVKGSAGISSSLGIMNVPFELSYTR